LGIESADPVDRALRDIELSSNFFKRGRRQKVESFLCFLENWDQFILVRRVAGEYFLQYSQFGSG
jgi:hypothetical protein